MIINAPDDVATPDDLINISNARDEYRRGETTNTNRFENSR
jgi:hypothetical protein